MPIINYKCSCGNNCSKFVRVTNNMPDIICNKCNEKMKRILSSPFTASKMVIDNGSQARSVEINQNTIELNEEKANIDYTKKD